MNDRYGRSRPLWTAKEIRPAEVEKARKERTKQVYGKQARWK